MYPKSYAILICTLLLATAGAAQSINLPRKSPRASTSLTIGYTEISVQYSSPAVNGRDIWGELVPYGEVWRAGANEATEVCFSEKVKVEGQRLPGGCYAFFLKPSEEGPWTAIFNQDTSLWGAEEYNPNLDALRVPVEPKFASTVNAEQLKYELVGQNIENGYILLSWGKMRLYLRLKTSTMERAVQEIQQTAAVTPEDKQWKVFGRAADFLLWVGKPEPALQYAQRSVENKPTSWGHWITARSYAAAGNYVQAVKSAKRAKMVSATQEENGGYFAKHREEIEEKIAAWDRQ